MSEFVAQIRASIDLSKAKSDMDSFLNQKHKVNVQFDAKGLSGLKTQLDGLGKSTKIRPTVDTSGIKKSYTEISSLQQRINSTRVKIAGLDESKNINQIKELKTQLSGLEKQQEKAFSGLKSSLSDVQVNKLTSSLDKANLKIKEFGAKAEDISRKFTTLDGVSASNKTLSWLQNNTKAAKVYGERLKEIADAQRNFKNDSELTNLNKQFKSVTSEASASGLTGKSFATEFHNSFSKIFQFSQIYGGINQVITATTNAVSTLKQVDDILTEISKVSDLTSSQLKQLGSDSFDYANKYGKTVTSYLEGVQEMNRSGFYGQKGIDLANTSVLAQAAGDMTSDVANSYLLATNAAYEYAGSAEKLNAVLDGQNEITNRNSVDMTDMAEATTQAGSMAAQAGVSIEQLSALVGTAVSRTKKDGNEVGTALKALFINLQNTQSSKIVGTFDKLGISMTKMEGDSELLKTPIELIQELAKVYNALPDGSVDKANILTNIGGKHHANILSGVLTGYSDYEKMLQDFSEGTGSAAGEAEKSANNWTGSLNKLSNSWTSLVQNFADSGGITSAINLMNGLVKGVDSVSTSLGPISSMIGLVGGIKATQNGWGKQNVSNIIVYNALSYKVA